MSAHIVVGTSSWADPGFIREWYPPRLPARERLRYYAEHFDAVEVNSTFYRVPSASITARWAQVTPPGFTFDIKLHRALSRHVTYFSALSTDSVRLAQPDEAGRITLTKDLELALAGEFLRALAPLERAGKLSSLLLQLAPTFSPSGNALSELDDLLTALAPRPVAVEFRNRDWLTAGALLDTIAYLRSRCVALVCVDAPDAVHRTIMPSDLTVATCSRLGYLRAHGRNAEKYLTGRSVAERFAYRYDDHELTQIAERASRLAASLRVGQVRVMMNNNRGRDAPDAAARLRHLLGQSALPTSAGLFAG